MEGIYVGRITRSKVDKGSADLLFIDHRQDVSHLDSVIKYDDTAYCLVPSDDIIINNDELLKLRDEVKRLTDECNNWKVRYSDVNNKVFQKGLAYGTLEGAYKNEKIAGELLLKDRDALKEKVEKLEAELMEIKTARTLREAYISGVEKGCEGLREERDRWKSRWNSVVTDIGESLKANGITFVLKEIHSDGNWDVVIDIPKLNEAKKKIDELEKKLADVTSKETYWRDRKEEEEDHHHYWRYTFDRAVKQAAEKGIHIDVRDTDEDCNAGVVVVDNMKAEELEKRVVALEKTNKNLDQKLGAVDNALEYWNNTYNDIVIAGKKVGVKIDIKGKKPDSNTGFVYVTNEKAKELQSQVVQMEDANQKLRQRISAADEEIEKLKNRDGIAYWRNTYYSAVEKAKAEGITIAVQGSMDLNADIANLKVVNFRAENLEKAFNGIQSERESLDIQNGSLKEVIDSLKNRVKRLEKDNDTKAKAVVEATDRGDHWKYKYDDLAEYWDNTYKDMVAVGKNVGVKISVKGDRSDINAGIVYIINETGLGLAYKLSDAKQKHDKKWQAMLDALKDKGVEVIYMGEEDGKPIIEVKIPKLDELQKDFEDLNARYINRGSKIECLELDLRDSKNKDNKYEKLFIEATNMKDYWYSTYYEAVRQSWNQGVSIRIDRANLKDNVGIVQVNNERAEELKKELEDLKSKKISTCSLEAGADGRLKFIYTYMDGHNESANINGTIDTESISHGTIPKCKSCTHYVRGSRSADVWCRKPVSKKGPGTVRRLSAEEAEGPACADFKAKE